MEKETLEVYLDNFEAIYGISLTKNIGELILHYMKQIDTPFSIGKHTSLEIIHGIIEQLHDKDTQPNRYGETKKISINQAMDWFSTYDLDSDEADAEYQTKIIDFRHKIAVIQFDLNHGLEHDSGKEFIHDMKNEIWTRSTDIEIHDRTRIKGDKIQLVAYLHDTDLDSDVSYTTFVYNEVYRCWMRIGSDNSSYFPFLMLDFRDYYRN